MIAVRQPLVADGFTHASRVMALANRGRRRRGRHPVIDAIELQRLAVTARGRPGCLADRTGVALAGRVGGGRATALFKRVRGNRSRPGRSAVVDGDRHVRGGRVVARGVTCHGAERVCTRAAAVVSHDTEGAVVSSVPRWSPSSLNCTPATAVSSDADAVMLALPSSVAPSGRGRQRDRGRRRVRRRGGAELNGSVMYCTGSVRV